MVLDPVGLVGEESATSASNVALPFAATNYSNDGGRSSSWSLMAPKSGLGPDYET
jgi:hypothetical protein